MARKKATLKDKIEEVVVAGKEQPKKGLTQKVEKTRTRRKSYIMDLRIQSPSALGYIGIEGIDTAPALVRLAKVKGIDVIAVTDYYSGNFVDRIEAAALGSNVTVLPGVLIRGEVENCNDVILTCLFPETHGSEQIKEFLDDLNVPASAAGHADYIVKLDFDRILEIVDQHEGLAIPSRMDKTPYRRCALPLLVEKYGFRAFDLAYYPESIEFFSSHWPKTKFQLLSFSNASALAQVGSRISKVKMAAPGFAGLRTVVERIEIAN